MLGKGIYLKTNKTNEGAADTEFADVVLKSKTDVGEKENYKLPDGKYLKDAPIKSIITCNISYLETSQKNPKTVPSKRRRELFEREFESDSSDDDNDVILVDRDTSAAKTKEKSVRKGGQKRKATNDEELSVSDGNGTKNKVSKQAPKQRKNTEPPVKEFRSFVLMEWGGGSIFWGIKKVVHLTDDFFVCNG